MNYGLLQFLFVAVGLLPFVPTELGVGVVLFVGLLTVFLISEIMSRRFLRSTTRRGLVIIGFLIFLMTINVVSALMWETSLVAFSRGLIPFLFLGFYLIFASSAVGSNPNNVEKCLELLLIATVSWACFILVRNLDIFPDLLRGNLLRLTYVEPDMLIPFGLIGCILALYGIKVFGLPSVLLVFVFLFLIIVSGYRSQLALIALVIVFRFRNIFSLRSLIGLVATVVSLGAVLYLNAGIFASILRRFLFSSGDTVRTAEINYAITKFWDAPLFGHGLGHAVPVQVTRSAAVISRFESDSVPYIHNLFFYFLMDTGFIGVLFLGLVLLPPISAFRRVLLGSATRYLEAALVTYIVLVTYFMISASFRQIQMMLVVSLLLRIIELANYPKVPDK